MQSSYEFSRTIRWFLVQFTGKIFKSSAERENFDGLNGEKQGGGVKKYAVKAVYEGGGNRTAAGVVGQKTQNRRKKLEETCMVSLSGFCYNDIVAYPRRLPLPAAAHNIRR